MKRILILSFLLCLSYVAYAEVNPYVALRVGYENTTEKYWSHDLYDMGIPTGTLSVGAALNSYVRTELAYTYKNTKEDIDHYRDSLGLPYNGKENVTQQSIMINGFFYPLQDLTIKPFVGAGLGLGIQKADYFDTESKFSYAFYIGADYVFAKHWTVELMGNYNSILAPYSNSGDIRNFGGSLGVRYNF